MIFVKLVFVNIHKLHEYRKLLKNKVKSAKFAAQSFNLVRGLYPGCSIKNAIKMIKLFLLLEKW